MTESRGSGSGWGATLILLPFASAKFALLPCVQQFVLGYRACGGGVPCDVASPLGHGFGIRSFMYRSLLSVGGFTLLSRATGFMRDIVMAAVMGSGPLSDAFFIAFRLAQPFSHDLRRGRVQRGVRAALHELAHRAAAMRRACSRETCWAGRSPFSSCFWPIAFVAMPWIVTILAPGIADQPEQLALAVELTRITFSYLLCVTVVTHLGGMLNAEGNFWAAAAAPVLLNIVMATRARYHVSLPERRARGGMGCACRRNCRGGFVGRRSAAGQNSRCCRCGRR